jgi:hypothetical protein
MGAEDINQDEIDRLVLELTTGPRAARKTAASQPIHRQAPASASVAPPFPTPQTELRPGNRWTNVRLLMPSRPAPSFGKRLALGSAIALPQLPDLTHLFRMPGPLTVARMWVGLGVVYSASMTFWPYPKTYLWGLVLYLLSLGLALVAGVWGARLSWESRLGGAHTLALGAVAWAVTLAALQTLPVM